MFQGVQGMAKSGDGAAVRYREEYDKWILIVGSYGSIRIDSLHYCPLEEVLRETRRKKNRRSRFHYDPDNDYVYDPSTDTAQDRVRLLADTLRSNYWLGSLVKYIKLPFNIREEFNRDVARAVGCCPNLRYIDLARLVFLI